MFFSVSANCFPGQYYNTIAKECRECPVGFYQPEQGQFFCVACEYNKVTSSTGSIGSARCVCEYCKKNNFLLKNIILTARI